MCTAQASRGRARVRWCYGQENEILKMSDKKRLDMGNLNKDLNLLGPAKKTSLFDKPCLLDNENSRVAFCLDFRFQNLDPLSEEGSV